MAIKVILVDGSSVDLVVWQKLYNLKVGSGEIGKYFSTKDARIAKDIATFGELTVNSLLMRVLDAFREKIGKPVFLNAFNRTEAYQLQLKAQGYRTAEHSPHVAKMAADIETSSTAETLQYVDILKAVAKELNIKIRIGYRDYLKAGQTFIHVDVCPEYYAKGKPYNNLKHPIQWESEITW